MITVHLLHQLAVSLDQAAHHASSGGCHAGAALGLLLFGALLYAIAQDEPFVMPQSPSLSLPLEGVQPGKRTIIVGAGKVGQLLALKLEATRRYHVVGFVDDEPGTEIGEGRWKVLGSVSDTATLIRSLKVEEVILAYAPTWQQALLDELASKNSDVRIAVVPTPYETLLRLGHAENYGDIAVVRLADEHGRASELIKRLLDVTLSATALLLLSPVCLFVAALVKATSPGPVIFSQERVGRRGELFTLLKFRTMVKDAEARTGPVLSTGKEDSRLTPLGRWLKLCRLDEVPQLWNVLRGEMSLVGPRPERPVFVEQFEKMLPSYSRRHHVKPGITGLAQVCGNYHTDARDKLRFDLLYVSNRSLWLDLTILFRTVFVVTRPDRH